MARRRSSPAAPVTIPSAASSTRRRPHPPIAYTSASAASPPTKSTITGTRASTARARAASSRPTASFPSPATPRRSTATRMWSTTRCGTPTRRGTAWWTLAGREDAAYRGAALGQSPWLTPSGRWGPQIPSLGLAATRMPTASGPRATVLANTTSGFLIRLRPRTIS